MTTYNDIVEAEENKSRIEVEISQSATNLLKTGCDPATIGKIIRDAIHNVFPAPCPEHTESLGDTAIEACSHGLMYGETPGVAIRRTSEEMAEHKIREADTRPGVVSRKTPEEIAECIVRAANADADASALVKAARVTYEHFDSPKSISSICDRVKAILADGVEPWRMGRACRDAISDQLAPITNKCETCGTTPLDGRGEAREDFLLGFAANSFEEDERKRG